MLPKAVLQRAQAELLDWNGTGTSVMEVSHRGSDFMKLARKSEQDLRTLLSIPDNYKVLFMHGGGRGQFFTVPMNLAKRGNIASHLVSGEWSKIAVQESAKYLQTEVLAENSLIDGVVKAPSLNDCKVSPDSAYFHYCSNETVNGIEIFDRPAFGDTPVVVDMSSNILSRPLNIEDYGIIYAGAQKNIGPAGLSIVIVREDLVGLEREDTPAVFSYKEQVANFSMYNTPPTFGWYLAALVFEWLLEQGGLAAIEQHNIRKCDTLYKFIDNSDFYSNNIHESNRSRMNIPFLLANSELDEHFLAQSHKEGFHALKGHRFVGGMRASIYNAMPQEGVDALVEFMREFERTQG